MANRTKFASPMGPIVITNSEMREIWDKDSRIRALIERRKRWEEELEKLKLECKEKAAVHKQALKKLNQQLAGLRNRQGAILRRIRMAERKWMGSAILNRISGVNGQISSRKYHLNKEKARRIAVQLTREAISKISMREINKKVPDQPANDAVIKQVENIQDEPGQEQQVG